MEPIKEHQAKIPWQCRWGWHDYRNIAVRESMEQFYVIEACLRCGLSSALGEWVPKNVITKVNTTDDPLTIRQAVKVDKHEE